MAGTLRGTANTILNRVAAEVGLEPAADPWSYTDDSFQQLRYLINTAGEELAWLYPWQFLVKEHSITTDSTTYPDGKYPLPSDFLYLLNQTAWDRTNDVPLYGPLSPQDWQHLLGRDLVSNTIYVSFRINGDELWLFPQPPNDNLSLKFEYVSRNWCFDSATGNTYDSEIKTGADIPEYDRTLLSRYVKVKFLEAKGFDTTKAQADLNQVFNMLTGRNKAAPILSVSGGGRQFPYLDGFHSVPDTGYGS